MARPLAAAILLGVELCAASIAFDTGRLKEEGALVGLIGGSAQPVVRMLFALAMAAGFLGYSKRRTLAAGLERGLAGRPVRWRWLAVHAVLGAATIPLSTRLFWGMPGQGEMAWLLAGVLVFALLAALAAVHALLPLSLLLSAGRATGAGWLAGGAALAVIIGSGAHIFWEPSAALTFHVVRTILGPLMPGVKSSLSDLGIGTDEFYVRIAPSCSGYEGVAMALLFSSGWIWYFRSEYRFPAALALPPAAAAAMWLLNCVRLAALVLIGHWGYPDVALGGFHSQAGWIAFLLVALGLCVFSSRMAVFSRAAKAGAVAAGRNAVAPYLIPFLAILAASMATRTVSGGFDWLYPAKVAAATAALWYFRRDYSEIQWKFGPVSILTGVAGFVLWIGMDRGAAVPINPELAASPAAFRAGWLLCRAAGAILTVPIAEELAFRGYLLRRLEGGDFEAVSWRAFTLAPVLASSLAFGAMHGGRWIEGTIVGALYAWAMTRSGRLGDAVAAHATTNALLAAWVVVGGRWQYW